MTPLQHHEVHEVAASRKGPCHRSTSLSLVKKTQQKGRNARETPQGAPDSRPDLAKATWVTKISPTNLLVDAGCFVGSIVGSVLRNLLHNPLLATKRICPTNGPLKGNHTWTIQRSVCKRTKDLFQLSNRPSETIWNFWRSQPHGPAVYQLSNHNPLQTNWSAKENCMQEPHSNFASKSLLSPKTPKVLLLLMKKVLGSAFLG